MNRQAYIYDAVRTPRAKGKKDGALHEVKPVDLIAGLLKGLQKRHDLDTARVDDVILGCVTATDEQGGNIGKIAPMVAGWDESVSGIQIDRFCGSALEAKLTARVIDVFPNNTLLIEGSRTIQVDESKLKVILTGVIRPQDIQADNTIKSTYIADAKIEYVEEGLGNVNKFGLLTRLWHWLNIF